MLLAAYFQMPATYYDPCGYKNVSDFSVLIYIQVYQIWSIEVIFYQIKNSWSFGNYMVRSKEAIDKYVNLLGVTYSLCVLLPFINAGLSEYKFKSPQDGKYNLSEHIIKELFFTKLLKTLRLTKNIATVEDVISYLASHDDVSNRIYTYTWYYIKHLP